MRGRSAPPPRTLSAGPSVFVAAPRLEIPEDDFKVFDASQLTVHEAAADEGSAARAAGGVTAFARQRERLKRVEEAELEELQAAMSALESAEGADGQDELWDDFVIAATQVGVWMASWTKLSRNQQNGSWADLGICARFVSWPGS
jgi:hypothetical protein